MARLGEIARPQTSCPASVPAPQDIIAVKAAALLPETGRALIAAAPSEMLGAGEPIAAGFEMRMMPCGLYAACIRLPEGFVRMVSVKMRGWRVPAGRLILPGDPEFGCQWSAEPGIAGCVSRPRVYLAGGGDSLLLRALGSDTEEDEPEWVRGWNVPDAVDGSEFVFPSALYPRLVAEIAEKL